MLNITHLFQFLYFLTPTLASYNAVLFKMKVILTCSNNFSSVTISLNAVLIY